MAKIDENEVDRKYAESLRAVDPRITSRSHQPRMNMLADDGMSLTERGMQLEEFIDPDDSGPANRQRLRRRFRYGR